MAQAAMIIHTRTRLCDFPSTLAVCPSMLGSSEVEQIRKQILAATRSIDSMGQNEVRQMIYTCGSYVIAGMVSFLKNLADGSTEDEKFYTDEKGRGIYTFVGFVFQSRNQSVPNIDKKTLWAGFKRYMEPVWERTVLETVASDFADVAFLYTTPTEPVGAESVAGITLYATGADSIPIFSYWLGQALKGKAVSFCSNITDFRVVKDRPFTIITTTANIVERMKREAASAATKPNAQSNYSDGANNSHSPAIEKKNPVQSPSSLDGQNSKTMLPVIMGVLFVVAILIFLISR